MVAKASGTAALAFTGASFGGAALNYLFQVHAATVLDPAAFGLLSAWLARVTLAGVVATVVQFVSLDHRLPARRWTTSVRAALAISVAAVALQIAFGGAVGSMVLGAAAIAGGVLLYALLGQLQARLQLGVIALSMVTAALVRTALPFAWARDVRAPSFYIAHAVSSFAGIVAIGAVVAFAGAGDRSAVEPSSVAAPKDPTLRLTRPILLAFAASLFPLLDVLVVSATQDDATTGAFSRIALAARVVFFVGAAALQILLPHELHAAETGDALPAFAITLRRLLAPAMIVFALVLAAALDQVVLHPRGDERTWLYASCVSYALLVSVLAHLNRAAAERRLGLATALAAGVVLGNALAAALGAHQVTRYALGALISSGIVLVLAIVMQREKAA